MEIKTTLKELIIQRTGDSARGKRPMNASAQECNRADRRAWAEHCAIMAFLGDKSEQEITVNYEDED